MENNLSYQEKELNNLSFLKLILAIIIIFYHSILAWGDNFEFLNVTTSSKILYYIQQFTTTYHTRCFTIISGYLFYFLKHEKNKYQEFGPFVFNKFKRLIIPFLFVGICFVVPLSAYAKNISYFDMLKELIIGGDTDQLWYLLMLFNVFFIFYILDKFIYKHHYLSFLIGFILLGIGYLLRSNDIGYFDIDGTLMYFLFFLIGYKFRQLGSNKLYNINPIFYLLYLIIMFLFFYFTIELEYFKDKSYINNIITAIMFITNGPIMFILFQRIANNINYNNKIYDFLKNKSFTMYLFHQQFIYLFIILTININYPIIHAMLVFVLTLLTSLIISLIFHSNKVTKFLIGEK